MSDALDGIDAVIFDLRGFLAAGGSAEVIGVDRSGQAAALREHGA